MLEWIDPPQISAEAEKLAETLGLRAPIAEFLARSGYADPAAARASPDPDYYHPQPPEALPGIAQALPLIRAALDGGHPILVWGDFDVDGQTATALLVQALGDLGGRVDYHIPVRAGEGHGIQPQALAEHLDAPDPPRLLITCDTGATAFEALELARGRGLVVVLTDHHELAIDADGKRRLPPCDAFVTPRLLPGAEDFSGEAALRHHPLAALPGAGAAYKLVEGLFEAAGDILAAEDYLDLVALGIVADVAMIVGDTRYLLQRGLRRLRQTTRPGLLAIFERLALEPEMITEEQVGFMIAPRLNALGRLGDANPAVELLTTADIGRARILALQIEGLNARRRLLTSQTLQSALRIIRDDPALLESEALLLAHPAWEPGIIGLVAGRLAERFGKPALLATCPPGGAARGSARSVGSIDITAALASQAHLLHSYGGHAMAAGFSLDVENLTALRSGLSAAIRRNTPLRGVRSLQIAAELEWGALDVDQAREVERLAPFGAGSPPPVFVSCGLRLAGQSTVGRGQEHLALRFENEAGVQRRMMWWGGAEYTPGANDALDADTHFIGDQRSPALPSGPLDVAYTLRLGAGRSGAELQIEFVDYRLTPETMGLAAPIAVIDFRLSPHPVAALERYLAERMDGALIWAEGEARDALRTRLPAAARLVGRDALEPCSDLVIWNAPPSAADLSAGLKCAQPQRVALFAVSPGAETLQPFLERLAGLARYAQAHTGGRVSLVRLATALAQRPAAARLGLEWMGRRGLLRVEWDESEALLSPTGAGDADEQAARRLLAQLETLLEESRAFRTFFLRRETADLGPFL